MLVKIGSITELKEFRGNPSQFRVISGQKRFTKIIFRLHCKLLRGLLYISFQKNIISNSTKCRKQILLESTGEMKLMMKFHLRLICTISLKFEIYIFELL